MIAVKAFLWLIRRFIIIIAAVVFKYLLGKSFAIITTTVIQTFIISSLEKVNLFIVKIAFEVIRLAIFVVKSNFIIEIKYFETKNVGKSAFSSKSTFLFGEGYALALF